MSDIPHAARIPDESGNDDPRLFQAVQEYLTAVEQGQRINRRDHIARYPEIAGELADCLDALAFVNSAAGEMSATEPRKSPRRSAKSEIDPATAQPLGDFKLLRQIGHGGMGTVYEATQLSLGRRVAVKVLPMAAALDERHLERFHNEAQAAARLHHTNIVPVFAVGCERSVHFYAMQLIEGHSLAEIIRDLRELADRPPSVTNSPVSKIDTEATLTTLRAARSGAYYRSAVKLAVQVAEALAYAHEAGIVHRDIKPANLLLDPHGKLWVTDFGLAQLNVDNGLTRTGDLIGTLRYMSPEQSSGRAVVLDQRTDIYSLGITLYELLTLDRALPGTTHEQLLYQIVHHQPRSLRAIDKAIPRELETIVNKAISKEPADRYASADAFADDLRRFLQDEPILARPPSLLDKGLKWTRRHKSLAASIFAVLALATLGFSLSTFLIAREQSRTQVAYEQERAEAIEAKAQRVRAERSGRLARQAVEFFSRIASEEMGTPVFSDVRREMLEESLTYYQSFLEDAGDSPSINAELATARAQVTTFLKRYTALDTLLRTSARMRLLSDSNVRREIGVTPTVVAPLLALASKAPISNGATSTDPAEQANGFSDQTTQLNKSALAAIGPAGMERLTQIYRQTLGPLAMSDPDVIGQLKLTRDQQAKIRPILIRFRNMRFSPPPRRRPGSDEGDDQGNGGPPDGHRPPPPRDEPYGGNDLNNPERRGGDDYRAARGLTMQEIFALLTPSQRDSWRALLGNRFAIESIHVPPADFSERGQPPGPPPQRREPPDIGF